MIKRHVSRIGIDFHVFDGKFQGSRSHLIGVFGEVTRLCPEFQFVFLLEKTDELGSFPGFAEPNVERVFMPRANPIKRLAFQLPRLRRALRLDLLHTQYVIPLFPSRGNAVTIHDILFEPFPEFFTRLFVLRSKVLMRRSARAADLLFTVSAYSKGEIARLYGLGASSIRVIPNAVDKSVFFPGLAGIDLVRARGLEPGGYLLTVGRIEPRKNHAGLIRAYAQLPGMPPPLVIVGQRDFGYGEFDESIQYLPPGRKVLVLSDVGDKELPALYRHAMLFAYPSFAEGFGMPPLEAMASGVPVVTSRSTAIPEVVGDSGLLVDPFSANDLCDALARLISNPVLRDHYAKEGLKQAADFTWKRSAEVLAASYRAHFN